MLGWVVFGAIAAAAALTVRRLWSPAGGDDFTDAAMAVLSWIMVMGLYYVLLKVVGGLADAV